MYPFNVLTCLQYKMFLQIFVVYMVFFSVQRLQEYRNFTFTVKCPTGLLNLAKLNEISQDNIFYERNVQTFFYFIIIHVIGRISKVIHFFSFNFLKAFFIFLTYIDCIRF